MSEIGCQIDAYVMAVAQRRALDKNNGVNVAVLMQLEKDDIPRLLEIIRVQKKGLDQCLSIASDDEDEDDTIAEMGKICAVAHLKAEELAEHGSKARWGAFPEKEESGNGHDPLT